MGTTSHIPGSLSDALVPDRTLIKDIALVGAGAALTALAAQVRIPWEPVPFTMQTLAVSLVGLSLGARRGLSSQLLYIALASLGLPLYAEGRSGLPWLLPTGGYLVGMAIAAYIMGLLAEKGWDRKVGSIVAAIAVGNVAIFGLGISWLALSTGHDLGWAIRLGFVPFAVPELIKSAIAVMALPTAWMALGKSR